MTHREHVSKEEAQAFADRIAQLEDDRNQALTRAEAAEGELRTATSRADAYERMHELCKSQLLAPAGETLAMACQRVMQDVSDLRHKLIQATQLRINMAATVASVPVRPVRLFRVQDDDRPMYVVAGNWGEAMQAWEKVVADENPGWTPAEEPPLGIEFVADHDELLLSTGDLDQVVR